MTMAEVMLSALILIGAATTSLQIWSLSMASFSSAQQRQLAFNRMDSELISLQRHWQRGEEHEPLDKSCQVASEMLLDELQRAPLSAGLQREVTLMPEAEALMVSLQDQNEPLVRREQLINPAALNLCQEV